jgi:class 3 adenylate cyclase/tetratricopeptide (TPR) repeat protein
MTCSGCGRLCPDSARFCVACGRALPRCTACGVPVGADYQFCAGCGRPLSPTAVLAAPGPAAQSAAPVPLAPHTEPVAAASPSQASSEQERRLVAILFADIVGFTALSERLDPEEVHDIMQSCLTRLAEVVTEHGGHVDKFIGDSVMALFGAPIAHEDDAIRAVAAALAMQARLESMNDALEAQHQVRLALRIGINAGVVVAGAMGRPGDYTVMGDAVNVASRIQGLAKPGSIVVTAPVRGQAGSEFRFTPTGSVTVKNRSTPVEVFEVEGERAPTLTAAAAATPFVGRERELSRLAEAMTDARAGGGSAVWLLAEAGMGKSRLVSEFVRSADPETLVLTGYCRGYSAPLYIPFRHWFEQLRGHAARVDLGDEAQWAQLIDSPEDFAWLRAALLADESPLPASDPETVKRVAHRALLQFVQALSQRAPLLLIVEDLHWADSLTLELLSSLAREAPRLAVLLLGTTRSDGRSGLPGADLLIGPLEADALEALLRGLLAPHPVSSDAGLWLIAATHGNPFFLEELTRSLQISGDLALREERWVLTRSLTELRVPDTVRGVVQARIDALDPLARTLVREAAVLGTAFDLRVLEAMTSMPGELEPVLRELAEVQVLDPADPREPHRRSFHQTIIQQVAYESLLGRRRRELHAQAAREIEAIAAGQLNEVVDDLAEHYMRAEVLEPAVLYLGKAAARAQSLYANERAQTLYTRLLELLSGASPDEAAPHAAAAAAAECGLADLESLAGNLDTAIDRLQRLLSQRDSLSAVQQASIRRRLGVALAKRGEPEAAERELAAAIDLTQGVSSSEGHREAAQAWYQRAAQCYRRGQYEEAAAALVVSEQRAAAAPDAAVQADCCLLRGLVHYDAGRRREAREELSEALRRKEAIGDLRGMAAALNNLGNLAVDEGRFADARRDYERGLELRWRIGHREGAAAIEINLGSVALSVGDWPEAQAHLERAQALCEEIGDAYGALAAAANRGRLALETGNAREARRRYQAAYERARHLDYANLAVDARIGLSEAELALGDDEKALVTAAAAREEAETAGDPTLVAAATRAAAMAAAATGRTVAAEVDFTRSRHSFRELGQPLEEARTLVRWAAALVQEDAARAGRLLDEAETLARELGAGSELARIEGLRAKSISPPSARGSRRQ